MPHQVKPHSQHITIRAELHCSHHQSCYYSLWIEINGVAGGRRWGRNIDLLNVKRMWNIFNLFDYLNNYILAGKIYFARVWSCLAIKQICTSILPLWPSLGNTKQKQLRPVYLIYIFQLKITQSSHNSCLWNCEITKKTFYGFFSQCWSFRNKLFCSKSFLSCLLWSNRRKTCEILNITVKGK